MGTTNEGGGWIIIGEVIMVIIIIIIIIIILNQRSKKGEYEKCKFDKLDEDKKIKFLEIKHLMFAFLHLSYIQRVGLEGSKILDLFLFSLIIYPGNLTNCKSLELVIY